MKPTFQIWNEDCIRGMAERLAPDSIHLTVTSIPFEELFAYSGKTEDVGNNGSTLDIREGRFALNMRFVVEQLYRVTHPGCNACIHIQQLLAYKNQHGFMGRRDFRGAMVDVFSVAQPGGDGFRFVGEFVIPKNPQAMANRLNLHSLQFKTGYGRTATALAPAPNDYVLIFQKPGEPKHKVRSLRHDKNPAGWVPLDEWVRDAHGVWSDVLEIDILDGSRGAKETKEEKHVCLARGSLVLTREGHKPIEDITLGDLVLTHRGRWRPVVAKVCNGIRRVVRTTAQGVANLLTTPDHEIYVRSGVGGGRWGRPGGKSHPRSNALRAVPGWVPADRTKGSYVNLKLPTPEPSPLCDRDWWLIGRWLGDGHIDSRGRAHISCSHDEAAGLVAAMGERAGHVAVRRTATQVAVKDRAGRYSTEFTEVLKACGQGAAGKRLPAEALCLDQELSEALLSGYLSADGHFVKRHQRWTASSVSRALLLGMAMVAQRARGVVASVYAGRPAGTCEIEGRMVNTRQDWILSIPPSNLSAMMLDDGAWKKVRAVEEAGEAEVWDIQVAEDESFTAEGCIVHNCPLQLEVIRRLVRLYTNPISVQPDVTVLDPFMGIGSTAFTSMGGVSPVTKLAVEEPRNAVGFELKDSYHRQAVARCAALLKPEAKPETPSLPFPEMEESA